MKLPVLKAYEDGTLQLLESNGWVQVTNTPDNPNCASLFSNNGEGEFEGLSLVIFITHLNSWAKVRFVLAEALNAEIIEVETQFDNRFHSTEVQLEDAVRRGFEKLAAAWATQGGKEVKMGV